MGPDWLLVLLHTVLFAAAVAVVVRVLRLLRRVEYVVPPIGARRMHFKFAYQDGFPIDVLPPELQRKTATGPALFLFLGPSCKVCHPIINGLSSLSRHYPDMPMVISAKRPWPELTPARLGSVVLLSDGKLSTALGIGLEPYVLKTVDSKIVDFGVVNTVEQVENFLQAGASVV